MKVFSSIVLVVLMGLAWLAGAGPSEAQVPPRLDILSAGIDEGPPFDPTNVAVRQVTLRLELQGPPICNPMPWFRAYGFLIDSDQNPATGVTDPAFPELGVEARICAQCDPVSGQYTSPLGPVTITTDPGTGVTRLEIYTSVGLLPSVDFNWIAFAQEDSRFFRLPDSGYSAWATIEIALY